MSTRQKRILLALQLLIVLTLIQSALANDPFPTSRDPYKWPFAQDSIWNTPIGSEAKYKPQPINPDHIDGIMVDLDIIIMTPEATLMNVYGTDQLWGSEVTPTSRCMKHDNTVHLKLPIPFTYTTTHYGKRPNNPGAILRKDGRTIVQTQPFQVCKNGYATMGLRKSGSGILRTDDVDLYSAGMYGMHGGSGLSSLGGAIRVGELSPGSGPIRHVLKISFPGRHYLYYDHENNTGYRWPARKHDGSAQGKYRCTEPEAKIGCLRAIPPSVNIDELGLETEPGRKIAWTLQNYGAYQVEGVPWARCMIAAEDGPDGCVPQQFEKEWGYSMVTQDETGNPWFRDMVKIFLELHIVTNNGPESIGGGGEPLQPLAPPIKPLSMGAWEKNEKRQRQWWYKCTETQEDANLAMRWTLSQNNVVAGIPPSWFDLLDRAIVAARGYEPIKDAEIDKLEGVAKKSKSVFLPQQDRAQLDGEFDPIYAQCGCPYSGGAHA